MMPTAAPHGKTYGWKEYLALKSKELCRTSSFMEGGLVMCCSSGPGDKNN